MQALRKIMVAKELSPVMDIPDSMQSIQVEVIVLPIKNIAAKPRINVGLVKNYKMGKYNVKGNS